MGLSNAVIDSYEETKEMHQSPKMVEGVPVYGATYENWEIYADKFQRALGHTYS